MKQASDYTTSPSSRYGRHVCFILTIVLLFVAFSQDGSAQQRWDDPHDYYQAQNSKTESRLLRNVEAYHLQPGIDRMNEERFSRAQSEFDFILRYFPNHPRALLLMSELSLKTEQPDIAHEYFQKAIELFPQDSQTYLVYGIFQQQSGDPQAAIEQYKKALERNPDSSETHYNLGLAYFEIGDLDKSKQHAKSAYELGYPLPGLKDQLSKAGAW